MASDYRVIPIRDAMDLPSPFQWPETQQQQFAAALEETLNRMSREGWELVAVLAMNGFIIFRRDDKRRTPAGD